MSHTNTVFSPVVLPEHKCKDCGRHNLDGYGILAMLESSEKTRRQTIAEKVSAFDRFYRNDIKWMTSKARQEYKKKGLAFLYQCDHADIAWVIRNNIKQIDAIEGRGEHSGRPTQTS